MTPSLRSPGRRTRQGRLRLQGAVRHGPRGPRRIQAGRRLRLTIATVLALGSSIGAPAGASPPTEDARLLLQRAATSFADGDFDGARKQLRLATGRTTDRRLLGQIQLQLGLIAAVEEQRDEARARFRQALRHDPGLRLDAGRYKPSLVKLFEGVREAMHAERTPPPDRVAIVAGKTAQPAAPPPRPVSRTARPAAVTGPASRANGGATVAGWRQPDREADRPAARRGLRWTWVAGGSAVAAAVVAIAFGAAAAADHDEACGLLEGGGDCSQRQLVASVDDLGRYRDLHDAVSTKRTVANVAWVTSGVLAAVTATLAILEWQREPADQDEARSRLRLEAGDRRGCTLCLGWQLRY